MPRHGGALRPSTVPGRSHAGWDSRTCSSHDAAVQRREMGARGVRPGRRHPSVPRRHRRAGSPALSRRANARRERGAGALHGRAVLRHVLARPGARRARRPAMPRRSSWLALPRRTHGGRDGGARADNCNSLLWDPVETIDPGGGVILKCLGNVEGPRFLDDARPMGRSASRKRPTRPSPAPGGSASISGQA
jgi:hypothetical protein